MKCFLDFWNFLKQMIDCRSRYTPQNILKLNFTVQKTLFRMVTFQGLTVILDSWCCGKGLLTLKAPAVGFWPVARPMPLSSSTPASTSGSRRQANMTDITSHPKLNSLPFDTPPSLPPPLTSHPSIFTLGSGCWCWEMSSRRTRCCCQGDKWGKRSASEVWRCWCARCVFVSVCVCVL